MVRPLDRAWLSWQYWALYKLMLVGRTKKQEAKPSAPAASAPARSSRRVESGSSIVERRMKADAIPHRSVTSRARYESRKKAETIESVVAQTGAAVGVLGEKTQELQEVAGRTARTRAQLGDVSRKVATEEGKLAETTGARQREEARLKSLIERRDKVNLEISQKSAVAIEAEARAVAATGVLTGLEKQLADLAADMADTQKSKSRSEAEVAALAAKVRNLEAEVRAQRGKVDEAKDEHEQVLTTIETAKTNFRVFERRIARLSRESGYIIGYPRVDKLKK